MMVARCASHRVDVIGRHDKLDVQALGIDAHRAQQDTPAPCWNGKCGIFYRRWLGGTGQVLREPIFLSPGRGADGQPRDLQPKGVLRREASRTCPCGGFGLGGQCRNVHETVLLLCFLPSRTGNGACNLQKNKKKKSRQRGRCPVCVGHIEGEVSPDSPFGFGTRGTGTQRSWKRLPFDLFVPPRDVWAPHVKMSSEGHTRGSPHPRWAGERCDHAKDSTGPTQASSCDARVLQCLWGRAIGSGEIKPFF